MGNKAKRTVLGLSPLQVGLFTTADDRDRIMRERVDEEFTRMQTLADRLGIPDEPGRWYVVALHLARQHVPELKENKRAGAPKKWGAVELGILAVEIERITSTGKTIEQAAKALAQVDHWRTFLDKKSGTFSGPDPVAALCRAYSNAVKHPFASTLRKAFLWDSHEGTSGETERDCIQALTRHKK